MKLIFITLILILSFNSLAGWNPISTGINDVFTGVVFSSANNGAIVGHNGLYYTNTGGLSPSDWTRFNIINNTSDSVIYNNTKFTHCTSNHMQANFNTIFACGQDTINNKAIIISFNIINQNYQIVYYGPTNSKLNYIQKRNQFTSEDYYAVGDNGLLVHFNSTNVSIVNTINTGTIENLNCVSGNGDSKLWIGFDGGLIRGIGTENNLTFNLFSFPNKNFKDLLPEAADAFYTVGNGYFEKQNLTLVNVNEYTNYENGPLNASSIFEPYPGSVKFVGTDHGIYRSIATGYLEIQPSTSIYKINEFWQIPLGTNTFFACGENGILLTTTDYGGPTKPNLQIIVQGSCVNSSPNVQVLTSSSTNCTWYLDGGFVSSSCSPFNQNFYTTGSHELKLIGTNGTYGDTIIKYFNVVNPPQINLGTIITDSILCKSESVQIEIINPELNTIYSLRKFGSTNSYGSSSISTGTNILYNSTLVSDSGIYYLRANSTLASNCYKNFTDTIHIDVEKTEAQFHANRINAYLGDSITFYNNSKDANLFDWTFSSGANLINSSDENVLNSFNQLGSTSTQLIVSSLNGCSDTLSKTTTFICTPNNNEFDAWYNRTHTINNPLNGNTSNKLLKLLELSNGHLTLNYIKNSILHSQNGENETILVEGFYLSKYDKLGTLLWTVKLIDQYESHFLSIDDIKTDKNGNIYFTSNIQNCNPKLVDNKGSEINLYTYYNSYILGYALIKLDSTGNFLWSKLSNDVKFSKIGIDNDLNLIVNATCYANSVVISDGIIENFNFDTITSSRYLKYDTEGNLIYNFKIIGNGYGGIIECDSLNNIYISSGLYPNMTFYSSNGSIGQQLNGSGSNFYIAKYNDAGVFQWVTYSRSANPNDIAYINDLKITNNGDVYFTGSNNCAQNLNTSPFMIYGPNGNISQQTNYGNFFIAKLSSNGYCEWIRALNSSIVGEGISISIDDDEVSILGIVYDYSNILETVSFYDLTSTIINISIGYIDYFIAVYDTSGNVVRFIKNGNNQTSSSIIYYRDLISIFKDENGMYYCGSNRLHNGNYIDFGFPFDNDSLIEGSVVKFDINNVIVITPDNHLTNHINLCNDSITFSDGNTFVYPNIPLVYESILTSSLNTDSIVTEIVNYSSPQALTNTVYVCRESDYTFLDNVTYENILNSTSRTYFINNGYGCNNQYTTNLIVVNPPLTATLDFNIIESNTTDGQLQWVDCATNFSPIFGEISNTFTPSINGQYAIIRNYQGCTDTSNCVTISNVNLEENIRSNNLSIFPNPFNQEFEFKSNNIISSINIIDINGKTVLIEQNINSKSGHVKLENEINGFYYIEINFINGETLYEKLIKID